MDEHSHMNPASSDLENARSSVTALTGVPFQFGASCNTAFVLNDLRNCSALVDRTLDFNSYEYDFKLERSFLLEHNIGNEHDEMELGY